MGDTQTNTSVMQSPKLFTLGSCYGKWGMTKPKDAVLIWSATDKIGIYLYDRHTNEYIAVVFEARPSEISKVAVTLGMFVFRIGKRIYVMDIDPDATWSMMETGANSTVVSEILGPTGGLYGIDKMKNIERSTNPITAPWIVALRAANIQVDTSEQNPYAQGKSMAIIIIGVMFITLLLVAIIKGTL